MKNKKIEKERIDTLLVEKKFFDSRNTAQRYILAGKVIVNDHIITKAGEKVPVESEIRIKDAAKNFVSRGGEKLQIAIRSFNIDLTDKKILDIGISTGGFADCALKAGAAEITGVDVGYGQLDQRLRNDPRVILHEKTNARYLELNKKFDFIICDVSFISLSKLLNTFNKHLDDRGSMIILIKPQFEAGPENVEKGGIVKDPEIHKEIIEKVKTDFYQAGFELVNITESDILLPRGNREYLSLWRRKA